MGTQVMTAKRILLVTLCWLLASCNPMAATSPAGSLPSSSTGESTVESSPSPWGPLAVIPPQSGWDTGRAVGTLRVTRSCVYLVFDGQSTLLFWPADRTRWNENARSIAYTNDNGVVATASNGDVVVLGGGGDSAAESGVSGPQWVSRMTWVAPPHPSCAADIRWGVGQMAPLGS
jgi:hypothetical protein